MPSQTSNIGALTVPVPVGSFNSDFDDPTVSGLADYLRFWLRDGLNTKLSNMAGTSIDAVPAANVYKFKPGAFYSRQSVPALYVWWDNKSSLVQERTTLAYDMRRREIHVLWLYDELVAPDALGPRHGILGAADAILMRAAERGRHPSYAYGSDAPGTPIWRSLLLHGMEYLGGEPGFWSPIPAGDADPGGDEGYAQRGFPALKASFAVLERIDGATMEDPADVHIESEIGINAGDGETTESSEFMTRVLEGPDGDGEP